MVKFKEETVAKVHLEQCDNDFNNFRLFSWGHSDNMFTRDFPRTVVLQGTESEGQFLIYKPECTHSPLAAARLRKY